MKKLKFLFIFIFSLFLNFNFVYAYDLKNNIYGISYGHGKFFSRTYDNNWGVNKHWNIDSSNLKNVQSVPYVDSSLKVYDFADILSDTEEKQIYSKIIDFVEKTNIDMAFVSIDMPYSVDSLNENFAADFYDYNDFGLNFSNYSGILLLRNNYSNDKYYDMYTFGDAQLYFDQSRYDEILDGIYSDFSGGRYLDGVSSFISSCSYYYNLGHASKFKHAYIDSDGFIKYEYYLPVFPCFIGASVITLIVMIILIGKNKMVKKATTASQYLDKKSINYSVFTDQFTHSHTTHYTVSSSSGGGSHGGSSGGGHSCGGGRHG
jgi:uncharacterized membrane protein YgcG